MPSSTPSPQASDPSTPSRAGDAAVADPIGVALGRIPSGLFVLTWRAGDHDRGMLASWVMQSGFEPPMITVAIGRSRELLAAVEAGTPFVVNVLAEDQRSLLARFGKPGSDAFSGLDIERTSSGTAAFPDAAAWLECRPCTPSGGGASPGDHVVVQAIVTAAKSAGDRQPLVHTRRNGLRY